MKPLADLGDKAVERTAEGSDNVAALEQEEIQRAMQLIADVVGEPVPILYVQMDGTGCRW